MSARRFVTPTYLTLLDEKEAKFLLEQAEKQLKEIIETSNLIVSRTTTLMTIAVGITLTLMGVAINQITKKEFDQFGLTSALLSLYMLYAVWKMSRNLIPTEYMISGTQPEKMFNDSVFNESNKEYRLKAILASELEQYQYRIEENKKTNDVRWDIFNTSYRLVKFTPVALIITFIISAIFFYILNYHVTHCLNPCSTDCCQKYLCEWGFVRRAASPVLVV